MTVSKRYPINLEVFPFHISQSKIINTYVDFCLSQTYDHDNGHHSYYPHLRNQALNTIAKSLGYPQYSTMISKGKKHQQQSPSKIVIVDHPNFLTLFPLHYMEAMQPHLSKTPFTTPISELSRFLNELMTKTIRLKLREDANGTLSAILLADRDGWMRGWELQLPKLTLTSKFAFFTVILEWYHTLVNLGYNVTLDRDFIFKNSQLFNMSCPPDLTQDYIWYQQYWRSTSPLNANIEAKFSDIDQRLNEYIRQQSIPYDFEHYGNISLRNHIFSLNQNGLIIPNAYLIQKNYGIHN